MHSHVNGEAGEAASTKTPSRKRMRVEATESSSSANPGVAFTVVLQQAIQSGDEERLGEIIRRGDIQPEVLQKTIEQMPVTNVVPFLELVARMVEDPALADPRRWMNWIHTVLVTHSSYLSSSKIQITNLDKRIGRLAEWMEKRATNLDKLLQLQGKLELVAEQMAARSKPVLFATQEPATVFDTGDGDEADGGDDAMETGSKCDEGQHEELDSGGEKEEEEEEEEEDDDEEDDDEEEDEEDEEDGGEVDDAYY